MAGVSERGNGPSGRGNGQPGRPRDPAVDVAILEATIRMLAAEGIERTSMDKVAAEAGTSKVTVYSRYSSKTALIEAALAHLRVEDVPPLTGDTEDDLVARLEHMIVQYGQVGGMSIIGTCLATEPRSSDLLEVIRRSTLLPRRSYFREVFAAAKSRGELRQGMDLDDAVSLVVGAFYADHLAGRGRDSEWPRGIVRMVLGGVLGGESGVAPANREQVP